jgi:predicted secreted acid phosphatase
MKSTCIYKCTYVLRYMSKKKGQIHYKREREADRDIETCEELKSRKETHENARLIFKGRWV